MLAKIGIEIMALPFWIYLRLKELQREMFGESKRRPHPCWYNLVSQKDDGAIRWKALAFCVTHTILWQAV